MTNSLSRNSWFPLIDLVCAALAAALIAFFPQMGGWAILIAIIPWGLRLGGWQFPFLRTRFIVPILVFLGTAAVGIWAAPQPSAALDKFWLLTASVILYFAVAGQPRKNLWLVAGVLSLIGASISVLYLLSADWQVQPSKIELFTRWMIGWMQVRPDIQYAAPNYNDVASLAAITYPFILVITIKAWRERRWLLAVFSTAACGLMAFTLLVTTVRGAWIALFIAAGLMFLYWVGNTWAGQTRLQKFTDILLMTIVIGAIALLGILVAFNLISRITVLLDVLPGAAGRLVLGNSAWHLISDYPFTGGGLAGFPGQYSQYILSIPYFFFRDSHNLFLDITFEQGVLGLLSFAWIFLGTILMLIGIQKPQDGSVPQRAILAGLLILAVHGLSYDAVYSTRFLPLLFIFPGMAISFTQSAVASQNPVRVAWKLPAAITAVLVVCIGVIFRHPLASAWYADLGAVRMAQVELADFPSGEWDEGQRLSALTPAEELFQLALRENAYNPTANYRLGLIALQRRDFPAAVLYLEKAAHLEPQHPGIQKSLGYSYAWSGQLSSAVALLRVIPGTRHEMENYRWWWHEQGRDDLANTASLLAPDLPLSQ